MKPNSRPYIVGCGYVGSYLAKLLLSNAHTPTAFVRSEHSLAKLQTLPLTATLFDLDQIDDSAIKINFAASDVYYFVPPNSHADNDQRIDRFLEICQQTPPRRFVYISTSGVYGDCNGTWVDETTPTAPLTARAKRRTYAEQALLHFCGQNESEYIILRVGGIYGAARLPIHRLADIKVICPEEAPFSNRIHVKDLAQICMAAMQTNAANEIINVADGNPSTMTDYYYRIADLAGVPRPVCVPMAQAEAQLSPGMLSFVNESRRLSIKKMQSLLNFRLQFPTLQTGLEDCFKTLRTSTNEL